MWTVDGNVYLSDTRALWSATAEGVLRWRTELVAEPDGTTYPFITPFFTRTGQVGGVTAAGRVVIYDRDTGQPMPGNEEGYRLPGIMDPGEDQGQTVTGWLMSKLLWNTCDPNNPTMIAPELIEGVGQAFSRRGGKPVANAPAVLPAPDDSRITRIYVAARLQPEPADAPVLCARLPG